MSDFKDDIFNVDIKRMNYIELARWLNECRNINTDNLRAVKDYVDEWEKHYIAETKTYNSQKFEKALLLLSLPMPTVKTLINGSIVKLDLLELGKIKNSGIGNLSDIIYEDLKENAKKYFERVSNCFKNANSDNYKKTLDEIVKDNLVKSSAYDVKLYKGKTPLKFNSTDDFFETLKTNSKIKLNIKTLGQCIGIGYQQLMLDNGTSKTIYNSFLSEQSCEQEFGKKFFVNLAFIMSLSFHYANTLLAYNGYSLDKSKRKFDNIVGTAFKVGYGRKITIALIDYENQLMRMKYKPITKKGRTTDNFSAVPNLNPIK